MYQRLVMKMETSVVTALVGAVALVFGAVASGFWQWFSSKGKNTADVQSSVMNGFMLLLAEFKAERALLVSRIAECEERSEKQDRHINKLERLMVKHSIEIPENGT